MIYIDSSVLLAILLKEKTAPSPAFWESDELVSSDLLEFEVKNRLFAYEALGAHAERARSLLDRIELYEMSRETLFRALSPFQQTVRTLDGLHLATMHFLRHEGAAVTLASFDKRLLAAAAAEGFAAAPLA